MDFPAQSAKTCISPRKLIEDLKKKPVKVLASEHYMAIFENEDDIIFLTPDFKILSKLDLGGVIVTAPGIDVDFVSRFFAPKLGIDEDPVTGAAHCELTPYWAKKLNKTRLTARQLSRRGGDIFCELKDDRILLSGKAVKYMEARIDIET